MRVLLTGFEPFGGETVNPSWQAVTRAREIFAETPSEAAGIDLHIAEVPCEFGVVAERLDALMAEVSPGIVISVGQAGGRVDMTPERIAINVDDARIADNGGNQPIDETIQAAGPAAYFSTLPIKAGVEAMRAAGAPSSVSQTAGTFVCNHIFYQLMHLIDTKYPGVRGGFVHVPYSSEQAAAKQAPSLSVETMARGLVELVKTSVSVETDIVAVGGAEH